MSIYFFICYYSQIVIDIIVILYKVSTVGFFQVYDIIAT